MKKLVFHKTYNNPTFIRLHNGTTRTPSRKLNYDCQ